MKCFKFLFIFFLISFFLTNCTKKEQTSVIVEEDVELTEFSDEIDSWVIEEFKKVGLDTAKSILELEKEDLIKRTDLEDETVIEVIQILKAEFEE